MPFRVAEVFPVQADVLLLHSLPEEGLVFPQHRLQTGAAEVSYVHGGISQPPASPACKSEALASA